MSDKESDETPQPVDQPSGSEPESIAPTTRDEALNRLLGDASELSGVRFGKIIYEGLDRLGGVTTVNVFQGGIAVDGDFVSASGSAVRRSVAGRTASTRLEPKSLVAQTEYFVPTSGFEHGVQILADTNLLFVSGPAGSGRETRAMATLRTVLQRVAPDADVFQLNGLVLGTMTWRIPQHGCGLLVVDHPAKNGTCAAENVGDPWLEHTARRLVESGSFLVVVTGPVRGALATASRCAEFVVEDIELPDPMEIVRRRISGELPWLAEDLDRRLAEIGLEETFADRGDPRFASRSASAVIEALKADEHIDLAETVGKLSDPEDHVREWLGRRPDLEEIAFVLATAVLEGASYLNVADAAVALYRQLSSSTTGLTPRYLRWLEDELRWIELVNERAGPPLLRFKQPRLRAVVLAMTWFELDGARTKILTWLKGLADHTDVEVRARAAQAAGIMADNDFEHGVHQYVLPWGTSGSPRLRQSAAQGLNMAGALGRHTESAWSYVDQWAELVDSRNARNLPSTAGVAVGGPLGVQDPHRALRVLRTLVTQGSWALLEPVAMSTQTLLEAGCGHEVLSALLEWSGHKATEESVVKTLTMFAFAVWPEESADDRPLLMRTADQHREALPELWGRALANESVRPLALDALRSWVRIANRDGGMRTTVLHLIGGIADRSTTDYERLLHALRGWARDPEDASDAATDFYNALVEAGEEAL
jgi:hypothetical protein